MATIGTFTKTGESFTGAVKTLSINAKTTIRPADKASDKAPDYRVFAGNVEFGAAWKKTSNEGREYLSVKLDDPSFPAPIYATLVEGEDDTHNLSGHAATATDRHRNAPRHTTRGVRVHRQN